jgi:hypothetical protein
MTIDFKLLEVPEWIKKREDQWKLIEWRYSDAFNRKERERLRLYFVKGVFPENLSIPISYATLLKLFPFQSKEGHAYVFKNFYAKLDWTSKGLADFVCQLLLDNSELLTFEERLSQFKWYMGDEFNSSKKFPFLLGQENEFRIFSYDHQFVLINMLQNLERWLKVDSVDWVWYDTNNLEYCLLDFIFSLVKVYSAGWGLDPIEGANTDNECDDNYTQDERVCLRYLIRDLMRKSFIKNLNESNEDCKNKKKSVLVSIEKKFNAMSVIDFSWRLIERWTYVKRRSIVVSAVFAVEPGFIEKWVEFIVRWNSSVNLHSVLLEREETISFLGFNATKNFELLEDLFNQEEFFFEDINASFEGDSYKSLFSASSMEVIEKLKKFLMECPINNVKLEISHIGG